MEKYVLCASALSNQLNKKVHLSYQIWLITITIQQLCTMWQAQGFPAMYCFFAQCVVDSRLFTNNQKHWQWVETLFADD